MSFSAFSVSRTRLTTFIYVSAGGIADIALSKEHSQTLEYCSELISHDVLLIEKGPEALNKSEPQ